MRHLDFLRNERGVTLALMAVTMFLMLGMAALAIDYGMIKSAKAEGQRAMDSAALAGASAFLINDPTVNKTTEATKRAKDFARQHTVHSVLIDTTGACGVAEVCVTVDLAKEEVKADFARAGLNLWFARTFGTNNMGITASATAHAVESGITTCLMPIAIADKWHNTLPDPTEDANGNTIWDYKDANGNGQWDYTTSKGKQTEPWEQWVYNPSQGDYYYPPSSVTPTGYSSGDYGHQMVLMTLDPNSTSISSNYLAWGKDGTAASDSALAARIRSPECSEHQLNESEQRAANGSKPNLGQAWADRINMAPSADWTWNNSTNSPVCGNVTCPTNWEEISPRVVAIGLYDPGELLNPQNNSIHFLNFAKIFLDKRPCSGPPGQCKAEVTGRFLGYVEGGGGTGPSSGPLVKKLVLIK
jgi:Flp pilus assembly protein TadG